ncbi:MAG: hypothetical protein VZQ98_12815 [Bacteroidales bacterium]|nr:hypothetical protein [Bacteroidales bacterium]
MQELFQLVYQLLDQHTCVIVPSFGGFIANDKAATRHEEKGSFAPPTKEVIFNHLLTHNDGLLAQELMKKENCTFEQANQKIDSWTKEITHTLSDQHSLNVSDWGRFTQTDGTLRFIQTKAFLTNKNSFGLQEFYFPKLIQSVENSNDEKKLSEKAELNNHSKRSLLHPFITGAAIATLLMMVSQPLQNEANTASFQPSTLLMDNLKLEVETKDKVINTLQSELSTYTKTPVGYYLILADFSTETQAQQFIRLNNLSDEFSSIQLLSIGKRFFVSVSSSLSKEKLEEEKLSLRNSEEMNWDEAYILSVTKMGE